MRDSPEHVVDVLASVLESLCFKIDASAEERFRCVQKVRERRVGYLFENMEKMSIQEERRKTAEAQRKAEEAQKELEKERRKAELAEERLKAAEETIRRMSE